VPPLDWDCDEDGDWEVNCPLIALAGDAVADPNWLLGVGLQRGWNSALDACFYADNVYNNKSFNGKPPNIDDPIDSPIEWSEHLNNLAILMTNLGNSSRDGKLSEEMNSGMLDEKGPVVLQLARFLQSREVDAPVPQYLPVVEPWYRYQEYESAIRKNYKGKKLFDNIHPTTTRELAIFQKNNKFVERGVYLRRTTTRPTAAMLTWSKRFECSAFWCNMSMKLIQIDGKSAPGAKAPNSKKNRFCEEKKEEEKTEQSRSSIVAAAVATREKIAESTKPSIFDAKKEEQKYEKAERVASQAVTKQRFGSPRINIAAVAKSYRPSGIRKDDLRSMDNLLSKVTENGKKSAGESMNIESSSSRSKRSVVTTESARANGIGKSQNSLSGINELSKKIDIPPTIFARDPNLSGTNDPMHEIRLLTVRYEQEMCKARLEVAQAKIAKAEAEEAVLRATKVCAQKEVEALSNLLDAYANAESKLRAG